MTTPNITIFIAIGAYVLLLALIVFISKKRETDQDFIIASKNVGWKGIGFSTFATLISSFNLVIGITFSFLFGIYMLNLVFGIAGAFLFVYWLSKRFRKVSVDNKFINIVDYFSNKYGKKVSFVVNILTLFVLLFFITLQINVNTMVFSSLLSWGPVASALFVVIVVFLYLYLGGFKTVVRTDIFQGILMLVILVLVFLVDTSTITTTNILHNLSDSTLLWSSIFMGLAQFLSLVVQPELWQRVYCAKNTNELRKGFLLSFGLLLVVFISEIIIGMAVKYGGFVTDPSTAFYDVLSLASPGWFFPIVAVSLFAAFMSTLDSSIFAMSSQLSKNTFRNKLTDSLIKKRMKWWMFAIVIITLIFSLLLTDFLTSVFQLVSVIVILGTLLVYSSIIRTSKKELFIGLLLGSVVFVYAELAGLITQEPITALYPSIFVVCWMIIQKGLSWLYGQTKKH